MEVNTRKRREDRKQTLAATAGVGSNFWLPVSAPSKVPCPADGTADS